VSTEHDSVTRRGDSAHLLFDGQIAGRASQCIACDAAAMQPNRLARPASANCDVPGRMLRRAARWLPASLYAANFQSGHRWLRDESMEELLDASILHRPVHRGRVRDRGVCH
jgi:hypothetical protein